jgi:hypothetical protein
MTDCSLFLEPSSRIIIPPILILLSNNGIAGYLAFLDPLEGGPSIIKKSIFLIFWIFSILYQIKSLS